MSETQQTTAERISAYLTNALDLSLIGHGDTPTALSVVSSVIAAEIDALTRERDEARAEVERLRPAAEAFGWWENYASNPSTTTWDIFQTAAQRARDFSFVEYRAVVLADDQTDSLKRGIFRAAKVTP